MAIRDQFSNLFSEFNIGPTAKSTPAFVEPSERQKQKQFEERELDPALQQQLQERDISLEEAGLAEKPRSILSFLPDEVRNLFKPESPQEALERGMVPIPKWGALKEAKTVEDLTPEEISSYWDPLAMVGGMKNVAKGAMEKFAVNIRLSKYPKAAEKTLLDIAKKAENQLIAQKRGVVTHTELKKLAAARDDAFDKLLRLKPGEILNAEEMLRSRQDLATAILNLGDDFPKLTELAEKATVKIGGATGEAGRLLEQFKVGVMTPELSARLREMRELAKTGEGQAIIDKLTNVFAGDISRAPGFWDYVIEWATAIKLTSPKTPQRAVIGNAISTILKTPERLATGFIDKVKSSITGKPQERFVQEAVADLTGIVGGLREATSRGFKALINEDYALNQRRVFEEAALPPSGAIPGTLGKIVRLPFRLVTAPDVFFRTLNERGSLYARATRQALKEGLAGEKLTARIDDLISDPPETMWKEVLNEAKEQVFQKDLTGFTEGLNKLRNAKNIGSYLFRLILPFFKTPVNLLKYSLERTPTALVMPSVQRKLLAGGGEASEVIGKIVVGSGMLSVLTAYALDGKISGKGPTDKAEKDALYRTGWQPYSVKIGQHWYSYRGLEPISSMLSFASNTAEEVEDPDPKSALIILLKLAEAWSNQPFLLGMSDFFDIFTGQEEYKMERAINRFATGMTIPTGLRHIATLFDPVVRNQRTFIDSMKAGIPGLSQTLTPRRNVFGEELKRAGTFAQRAFLPITVSPEEIEKVDEELTSINYTIGFPAKAIRGEGLDDETYDALLDISGSVIKAVLVSAIETPEYQNMGYSEKKKVIDDVVRETRSTVRDALFVDFIVDKYDLSTKGIDPELYSRLIPAVFENPAFKEMPEEMRGEFLQNIIQNLQP